MRLCHAPGWPARWVALLLTGQPRGAPLPGGGAKYIILSLQHTLLILYITQKCIIYSSSPTNHSVTKSNKILFLFLLKKTLLGTRKGLDAFRTSRFLLNSPDLFVALSYVVTLTNIIISLQSSSYCWVLRKNPLEWFLPFSKIRIQIKSELLTTVWTINLSHRFCVFIPKWNRSIVFYAESGQSHSV